MQPRPRPDDPGPSQAASRSRADLLTAGEAVAGTHADARRPGTADVLVDLRVDAQRALTALAGRLPDAPPTT